jgi:hypothetical protein
MRWNGLVLCDRLRSHRAGPEAERPSWFRERGTLAYIGPVCAYQAGFSFSLAVSLNPDGTGEPGEKFSTQGSAGRMPAPQVCVGFDDVVMDSTGVESWQFTPGQPVLRDCGWTSSVLPGQLNPRHVSRWWVSPLPLAGTVEFTVTLPGPGE